jgi:GTP-binding protein EngB required for normal cell division
MNNIISFLEKHNQLDMIITIREHLGFIEKKDENTLELIKEVNEAIDRLLNNVTKH